MKAGFHEELLPTWGGKAQDILRQPKCWSSKTATQRRLRAPRASASSALTAGDGPAVGNGATGLSLPGSKPGGGKLGLLDDGDALELVLDGGGDGTLAVDGPAATSADAGPGPGRGGERGSGAGRVRRRWRNEVSALDRVMNRCEELRCNPDALAELQERVQAARARRKGGSGGRGRNLVLENKWLNDDKHACLAYWERVAALQQRIEQAPGPAAKALLYEAWPQPPPHNHSRAHAAAKLRSRAVIKERRLVVARAKRESSEKERLEELLKTLNKKELVAEKKRRLDVANRLHDALYTVVAAALTARALGERAQEVRQRTEHLTLVMAAACKIQRRWKRSKATEQGLQYRNAIRVVRRFAKIAVRNRQASKKRRAADMIKWFLSVYENSNFQLVMRNYRYRVVHCQRYFRSYVEATRHRLKALGVLWDRVERERLRHEHHKVISQMRKGRAGGSRASGGYGAAGTSGGITAPLEPKAVLPAGGALGSQPRKAKRRKDGHGRVGARAAVCPESKRESGVSSVGQTVTGGGTTAATGANLAAAVELGMHVHQRVPKNIKRDVLREYLARCRNQFRRRWREYCRTRNITKAQSRLVTVEDVRAAIHSSQEEMLSILDRKMSEQDGAKQAPALNLFAQTTEQVMNELIDRGRVLVEDQFLDVLHP